MTATAKTTFAATSPTTAEVFTRTSARAYTFAVVYARSAAAQREAARLEAESNLKRAAEYRLIADLLDAGVKPLSGALLEPAKSLSGSERAAGVRTRWDAVEVTVADGKFAGKYWNQKPRAERVAQYREWANQHVADASRKLDECYTFELREAVTFHHTEELARKAALAEQGKGYWDHAVTVVPCEALERKPKGAKAAWAL